MVDEWKLVSFFGENLTLLLLLIIVGVELDHIRPEKACQLFENLTGNVILQVHARHSDNRIPKGIVVGSVEFPDETVETVRCGQAEKCATVIFLFFF